MSFNFDTFLIARDKVMSELTIVDYYREYVDAEVNLDEYNKACCPIHDEDTPSFFYFEDTGTFHCFGCGAVGGVVELHHLLEQRDNPEYKKSRALVDLAKMYKISIPSLFETAGLKDIKRFSNHKKLKFKPKDKLKRPIKKVETDLEKFLMGLRDRLSIEDRIQMYGEMDEIFFRDGEVDEQLNKLKEDVIYKLEN